MLNREVVTIVPQLPVGFATGVLTSDNSNNTQGDTVTINGHVYTFATSVAGIAASGVLTSDNTNNANNDTVVIGSNTYTFKTNLTETKASGVLTSNNTNVSDNDTVTIGAQTYRFKTVIAQINDVLIGASADASLTNLASAINGAGTPGTDYFTGTPLNSDVTSSAVSSHALTLTDKTIGTAGNSVATTKVATTLSWGATTLTGGANSVANEIKIGASADASLTNLAAAVNGGAGSGTNYSSATVASTEVTSGAVSSHTITLTAAAVGTSGNALASTTTGSHLSWGAATLTGGINAVNSVLIGASADASLTNLASAINGSAGAGSTYGTGTPVNTDVTSGAVTSHTITVTAIVAGASGNDITTTKSASHLTWGDSTLDGGEGGALTAQDLDAAQSYTTNSIDVAQFAELLGFIKIYSHSGTNPTLDCKMQLSADNTNWVDSGDTFTQLATSNVVGFKRFSANFGKYVRFVLTLGGTTPHYNLDMKVLAKL